MQLSAKELFDRNKRRQATDFDRTDSNKRNSCDRNRQGVPNRLFTVLKSSCGTQAQENTSQPQASVPSANPFAKMPSSMPRPLPSQSCSAAKRRTTPPLASSLKENAAPAHPEQHARHAAVRNYQRATRLDRNRLFTQTAERSEQAKATWKATGAARRAAPERMQAEQKRAEEARRATLKAHKERLAKRVQALKAAHREKEAAEAAAARRAWAFARQKREPADTMWPRNEFEARFGDDYGAYKEWKSEEENFAHQWDHFARGFSDEDPDDCWGQGSDSCGGDEKAHSWDPWFDCPSEGSYLSQETATASDTDAPGSAFASDAESAGFHTAAGSQEGDGWNEAHGAEDWEQWQGPDYESFKRSWHRHSRSHHHAYYYTQQETNGAGGGASGYAYEHARSRGTASVLDPAAAAAAGSRAREAARKVATSPSEEGLLDKEVEDHVTAAARSSGVDVVVFAAAFGVEVDGSSGAEQAQRQAKKALLLRFHPDKLQGQSAREMLLGQHVTQALIQMSAR